MKQYIAAAKVLCEELEQLHFTEPDINNRATQAAKLIQKTLTSFRKRIRKEGFQSTDDEIHFFKYVKPRVNSYLIFFSVLAEIEANKMLLSTTELSDFIDKKQRMFRYILRENVEFTQYYRSGMTHLDSIYFVREANLSTFTKHSTNQLLDPEFNTSHDLVAANIMAFDLFQKHLSPKPELQPTFGPPPPKLKWTASKASLVELIYALHYSGSIQYGDSNIKEISELFERTLNIKLKDIYSSYRDIQLRKGERAKYLISLVETLDKKIEESEELN
jgi:hypothetical protein